MHPELLNNPTFLRYYGAWQQDPRSLVFAPIAEYFCQYGQFAEARKICEAGAKHNPQSVIAHFTLAKIYVCTREWHAARHELHWVLNQAPNHSGAKELVLKVDQALAVGHAELDTYPVQVLPQASARFSETARAVLAAPPTLTEPLVHVASAERVVKPSARRLRIPPLKTVTMAKIYAQQGYWSQARSIYKTLLANDPTNADALAGLATMERMQRDAISQNQAD